MTASKDQCGVCKKAFYGKQKSLRCCGPCASRFHQACLRLSDSEYSVYFVNGESTYQCDSCRLKQRAGRSDDTPLRPTPRVPYHGDHIARNDQDIDLLGAQLEAIRSNGESANKLIENLVDIVQKLSDEVKILRKDNENLNVKLDHIAAAECRCRVSLSLGATCREAPPSAVPEAKTVKSYRDVLTTGSTSRSQTPANPENPGRVQATSTKFLVPQAENCDEGFTAVVKKKRNKPDGLPISGTHKSRPAMVGARNSSCLPVTTKKPKLKSLFISRLGPDVSASDVETYLQGHLKLASLTCTKLKTKFNSYSSFHVSVMEDDFLLVNDSAAWPNGCLIAPFYGRLSPEQVYVLECPDKATETQAPASPSSSKFTPDAIVPIDTVRAEGGGTCPSE